jgi:hypothetical protein
MRLSAVRRFCREVQFFVDLIRQFLRLFRVALQVPFIGLLSGGNLLPRLHAQSLSGSEIRMAGYRYIPFGRLSDGNGSDEERAPEDNGKKSAFDHGSYSLCVEGVCGNRQRALRYNWNLPDSYIVKGV